MDSSMPQKEPHPLPGQFLPQQQYTQQFPQQMPMQQPFSQQLPTRPQHFPQQIHPQPQPISYVVQAPLYGDAPVQTTCQNCRKSVVTNVKKVNGSCTWIWCFVICMCCFPCFFIPFITDCAKDTHHSCPSCGTLVGVNKA